MLKHFAEAKENFSELAHKANLAQRSAFSEQATLGSTFDFAANGQARISPQTVYTPLLPAQRSDLLQHGARIGNFDYYYLKALKKDDAVDVSLPLPGLKVGGNARLREDSLISVTAKLASVSGFDESDPQLNEFKACCRVTGSCGDYLLTQQYVSSVEGRILALVKDTVKETLQADFKTLADAAGMSEPQLSAKIHERSKERMSLSSSAVSYLAQRARSVSTPFVLGRRPSAGPMSGSS
jgi:hypothetical protein